jgi:hypothetical protein
VEKITFTIGDKDFQAEKDMTWKQWTESKYNTENYYVDDHFVFNSNGAQVYSRDGEYPCSNDTIDITLEYYLDLPR